MKRFKIGFLAVIAVLAMSFTIATNSNIVKKIGKKDTYTCVQNQDISAFSYCNGTSIVNITRSTAATVPSSVCAFSLTLSPDNLDCTGANNFFCCATSTQSCQYRQNCDDDLPLQTGSLISTVYHKPNQ